MSERPPEAALWDALRGGLVTRALALAAELDVARALAAGFAEEQPGIFRNTEVSELLTVDGWDDFACLGGGNGSLLRGLLERYPRMRGIVFDLPETVRDEESLGERCAFVAGSFFEEVPRGITLAAGRERTEAQWRALLEASRWEPTRFEAGVIEARPCP